MEPGGLIASGRDGDIFEFGPGLVLRKARDGRSIEHEARIMQHAADHGFPVPKIHEVRADGSEIVMERIVGPLMMDAMLKQPWAMRRYASMLADLHDRLHEIPAPDWVRDGLGTDDPAGALRPPSAPCVDVAHWLRRRRLGERRT